MPFQHPYLGVAGVTTPEEVRDMLRKPHGRIGGLAPAVGVLASLTTLEGTQAARPPQFPARYPPRELWAPIFAAARLSSKLGLLHYNGPNGETLPAQLDGALRWAGGDCYGIQLNIAWPNVDALRGLRIAYPALRVIFQLSAKALKMAGDDPKSVARRLVLEYGPGVDLVLLDPSGGTGKPLTLELALPYLETLGNAFEAFKLNIGLGIAGGFGPRTMEVALRLLEGFPNLSIDMESQVRDADDRLDLAKVSDCFCQVYNATVR